MGWAHPSSGEHLPREGLEQEGEAAARTDSRILSAPYPQLPEPAGEGQGPNLGGGKGISPTETGQALE